MARQIQRSSFITFESWHHMMGGHQAIAKVVRSFEKKAVQRISKLFWAGSINEETQKALQDVIHNIVREKIRFMRSSCSVCKEGLNSEGSRRVPQKYLPPFEKRRRENPVDTND